ncbi:hypothetical protein HHK36_015566 [Tetracentron sinense]|uniref:Uncharacterized protein n=1 Tax=Tetracentron sinense TaxID=13715 RepID=A0A834Z9F9_TETSI|nr:hypothetical protein HHK36_015566 [Tetracentron sinense]
MKTSAGGINDRSSDELDGRQGSGAEHGFYEGSYPYLGRIGVDAANLEKQQHSPLCAQGVKDFVMDSDASNE